VSARKLACVIGWPVARSLSPAIHNAAFEALGLDWTYMPLAVRPGSIEQGVGLLRELGVEGANVTMPHKQAVVPFLERLQGDAERLHAVNTIVRDGATLVGHNTDGPGFLAAIAGQASFDPGGKTAIILGAGGAARAIALALAAAGASVVVSARRPEQAADVAGLAPGIETSRWGSAIAADLVVNATPSRDGLPIDALSFAPGVLAVDLIYLPPSTPFLLAARAAGAQALDGIGMLVHQAALSFLLWTGREAPIDVMRAAAVEALAGDTSDVG
jgi:shikimate dehydrogenase